MKPLAAAVGDKRGIALVHALVLAIFVIAIALGLTTMLLQRFAATAKRNDSNTKTAIDAGTLARLQSGWAYNSTQGYSMGGFCSKVKDSMGDCECTLTAPCGCSCTCTVNGDATGAQTTTVVNTPPASGNCAVTSPSCDQCKMVIRSAP